MLYEKLISIRDEILNEEIIDSSKTFNISLLTLNYLIKVIGVRVSRAIEQGLDTTKLEDFLEHVGRTMTKIRKFKKDYLEKNFKDFSNAKNGIKKLQKDIEDDLTFQFRYLEKTTEAVVVLKLRVYLAYLLSYLNLISNKIDLYVYEMFLSISKKDEKNLNLEKKDLTEFNNYKNVIEWNSKKMATILNQIKNATSLGGEKEAILISLLSLNKEVAQKSNLFLGNGAKNVGSTFTSTLRRNNQKKVFEFINKNLKFKNKEKLNKNI